MQAEFVVLVYHARCLERHLHVEAIFGGRVAFSTGRGCEVSYVDSSENAVQKSSVVL